MLGRAAPPPGPGEDGGPATHLNEPVEAGAAIGSERISVATQRQLVWWRFRRHKLAMVGGAVVLMFYMVALFADFLAYAQPNDTDANRSLVPPGVIQFEGLSPYVHPVAGVRNPESFQLEYLPQEDVRIPVKFFARGFEYRFLGLVTTDIHLIGVDDQEWEAVDAIHLLGTDNLGRDVYSRLIFATRTSLTLGLVGVALSLVLGVAIGAMSGFHGGWVDTVVQRVIEILRSIPTIPLWLGLAAAMPRDWSVQRVYVAITVIVSLIGWTELARIVRGRFLQLREEEFVTAARLVGVGTGRLIFVHMAPLLTSHIIAATTLAVPLMIIAETSLSFLGLGLRAPAVSWGVMLQQSQSISAIALTPWMLFPVIPVIAAVLAFNFLGDGLRDAADPYDS